MTPSEGMESVVMWMMIAGGMVGVFGLVTVIRSANSLNRGDLSKPLIIVGFGLFLLGGFLQYQWGTYW